MNATQNGHAGTASAFDPFAEATNKSRRLPVGLDTQPEAPAISASLRETHRKWILEELEARGLDWQQETPRGTYVAIGAKLGLSNRYIRDQIQGMRLAKGVAVRSTQPVPTAPVTPRPARKQKAPAAAPTAPSTAPVAEPAPIAPDAKAAAVVIALTLAQVVPHGTAEQIAALVVAAELVGRLL